MLASMRMIPKQGVDGQRSSHRTNSGNILRSMKGGVDGTEERGLFARIEPLCCDVSSCDPTVKCVSLSLSTT